MKTHRLVGIVLGAVLLLLPWLSDAGQGGHRGGYGGGGYSGHSGYRGGYGGGYSRGYYGGRYPPQGTITTCLVPAPGRGAHTLGPGVEVVPTPPGMEPGTLCFRNVSN